MKTILTLPAILFLTAAVTGAAVITQTETRPDHVPPGSYALTFDQFDTSLGTLDSIQIILSLSIYDGNMAFDNDSLDPVTGTGAFGVQGALTSTDVTLSNGTINPWGQVQAVVSHLFNLDGTDGDSTSQFDIGGDDYDSFSGPSSSNPQQVSASDFVASAHFAGYQGTGTFDVDFGTDQIVTLLSGGVAYSGLPAHSLGSVTVIYNYTPVPEPATASLAGLGALLLLRRRRR